MKNSDIYTQRMGSAIGEKLFFLNTIDINDYDLIVDFGCADGFLLEHLSKIYKGKKSNLFGYDIDSKMIEKAEELRPNLSFSTSFVHIRLRIMLAKKTLIIFSSVLHEVGKDLSRAIELMEESDTVIIRDMREPLFDGLIDEKTRNKIFKKVETWFANGFEEIWGHLDTHKKLYRFFLMNEFTENYETEVNEDYFGIKWQEIDDALKYKFDVIFKRDYTLPYRQKQVKKLFNYDMTDFTHRTMIYEKHYNDV